MRVTWFGHSSALVEIDGHRVLIDPLWSERPSPVSWLGPKVWFPPPVPLEDIGRIDAVVISHDHYDHLDRATVLALLPTATIFAVPLGVGANLARWGIPDDRIVELDWWQSTQVGGIEITATPARHASGRISTRSDKTLWASYAIIGPSHRVWYSGDSGFHDDLPRIGEHYGPFDLTLVDVGQYNPLWPDAHFGPELAVQAHRQVRGKAMLPVHWGNLALAEHGWTEPVERTLTAAECRHVTVLTPRPGEAVEPSLHAGSTRWWPQVPWKRAAQSPLIGTKSGQPEERLSVPEC